jgi:hypothetical protein
VSTVVADIPSQGTDQCWNILIVKGILILILLERRDYYQEIIYMICWGCSQTSVERPTVLLSSQQYIVAHTYVSTVQS